mmetsp:Transcript_29107/g.56046  ORF Transcript_29107/g.56046 Transcript_29107/m.56046 type:complete len:127 (+) Transcript_29107:3723-4103(+)
MDMGQLERAQRIERILERRAARAKRSKWLGRLLFSLTGMGLLLMLRMYPDSVADVVAYAQSPKSEAQAQPFIQKPGAIQVRRMPNDAVPVRRGGTLPGNGTRAPQDDTRAQADALGQQLRDLRPGG